MPRVREWFDDFAAALVERSARVDLPEPGTEFWENFERSLVRQGATWPQADEASSVVCELPNLFPNQYLPMILEAIKKIQARTLAEDKGLVAGSLDEAKALSRDCPDCLGAGGAVRYVHESIHGNVRTHGGGIAPVGMSVTYPCSCPVGRMMARGLRQEGQARDPLHVGEYPSLRMGRVRWSDAPDNQYRYRPSQWDEDAGMPVDSGEVLTRESALAALKRLTASLDASRGLQPPVGAERARGRLLRDLDALVGDPVIDAEVSRPEPPPRPPVESIPEDAEAGWF